MSDWGEGSSDAGGQEGKGTTAATGDATWVHSFYDTHTWSTVGGDFEADASASRSVSAAGSYTWSSAGMVADVQARLETPATDFGWMIRGDESASKTAKRFDSRQHSTVANRPLLTIEFDLPATHQAPVVVTVPDDIRSYVGSAGTILLFDAIFEDPDGDLLSFTVQAATADIVALGTIGVGQTVVTMIATDPDGASTSIDFLVEGLRWPGDFDDFFAFADVFGTSVNDVSP